MSEVWQAGDVTLYLGDCLEILPTLAAGSVDAVVTDIPYGTTACSWDSIIPFVDLWRIVKHVLKPRGVFVTTASQPFTSAMVMSNPGWFKYEWIFNKNFSGNFALLKTQPNRNHENILVFSDGTGTYNPQLQRSESEEVLRRSKANGASSVIRRKGSKESEHLPGLVATNGKFTEFVNPKTVIRIDGVPKQHIIHPTQKPVALFEYLIRTYTNEGDTVLDITMGSGTTGVACVQTGRKFIGIEIEPKYFEIAKKRIQQAQLQIRMEI